MTSAAEAARYLAERYNPPMPDLEESEFVVFSRSRPGVAYRMAMTPDGIAIHQGEGCEGEPFNGPFGCWHSRTHSREDPMTNTALVKAESVLSPAPVAFNSEQMQVITDTICKGATPTELQLFVATCTRTGLDPFMRQIYAVKRYDSREKREVMAIQIGIDGMRLIAERTGKYAGQDPIEWLDADGVWSEVWTGKGEFPVAARCSVYRKDWPKNKATAVCRWDSYAQYFGSEKKLSPTWDKMPDVMLGKCAESLALRKAFPAEMSALAAVADSNYDPSLDYELDEAGPEYVPPAGAIDGRVVEHGATQQEGSPSEGMPLAAPPPDDEPAMASQEQQARLRAALEEIRTTVGADDRRKLYDRLEREWPHAFLKLKTVLSNLREGEARAVLALVRPEPPPEPDESVADQPSLIS